MTTFSDEHRHRGQHRAGGPALRPLAWSALLAATIGVFLAPMPALAAPPGVPDTGSRPTAVGNLPMPGGANGTPVGVPLTFTTPASARYAQVEAKRAQVALLGDRLLRLRQDEAVAKQAHLAAQRKHTATEVALQAAQRNADKAARDALRDAAGMPGDEYGSHLHELGDLADIQRGNSPGRQAAVRALEIAIAAESTATTDVAAAATKAQALAADVVRLDAEMQREQAALTKLEQDNAAQIAAAEQAQNAINQNLSGRYLGGDATDGTYADPRALKAVEYALKQVGDPYVWGAEGPDAFDCSGLVLASYVSAGHTGLPRVSYDQYAVTRDKTVQLNALLPGDLIFFAYSAAWTDVHHVAMYVGDGKMVEAPRSGVPVRVTTVRWSSVYAATRVLGAVTTPARKPVLPPVTPDKPAAPSPKPVPPPPASNSGTGGPSPSPADSPSPSPSTSSGPSPSPSTSPSPSPSPPTSPSPTPDADTLSSGTGPTDASPDTSTSGSGSASPSDGRNVSASAGG